MKKLLFVALAASVATASCKKDDDNQPTTTGKGSWTVGSTVHKVLSSSQQYGAGALYVFDSTQNTLEFLFPDTTVAAGTYTIVRVPTPGRAEMGIVYSDKISGYTYQTTGSDHVSAVVTKSSSGAFTLTIPACRISTNSRAIDSTTLTVAVGPL